MTKQILCINDFINIFKKNEHINFMYLKENSDAFIKNWFKCVKIIGLDYFLQNEIVKLANIPITDTSELITDRYEIVPATERLESITDIMTVTPVITYIEDNIKRLPENKATLLAVMCFIFNSDWGGEVMKKKDINYSTNLLANLEDNTAQILKELYLIINSASSKKLY